MTENRKRNVTLTIRVTEKEKASILKQVQRAKMSLTDYLVAAALNTKIYVPEDLKPIVTELKRIGTNLNQITMKINMGVFKSYNFSEVIEGQRKIYEALVRMGGKPWRR